MKNGRCFRMDHRQFLLNQADEIEAVTREKRIELQQLAVKKDWTLDELDEFCREMFGARLVGLDLRHVAALLTHFKGDAGQ